MPINATPIPAQPGEDTFTGQGLTGVTSWKVDPTLLPPGNSYQLHSQLGTGPMTVTTLTQGAPITLGSATNPLTAFMTYTPAGGSGETRFTTAVPATTGAAQIVWNPGQGMPTAPQPSITITIVTQKPDP